MNINRKAKHVHLFLHIPERIYPNPLREPFHNPPAAIGGLWMAKLEHPHHDPPSIPALYCGTHVAEARITADPFQIRPACTPLSRLISVTGLMSTGQ